VLTNEKKGNHMRKSVLILAGILAAGLPAIAQEVASGSRAACASVFNADIAPSFTSQSNGVFITVDGDCSAVPGCDDFFDVDCAGGETLEMSFCSNGGTGDFDTALSTWNDATFTTLNGCDDDFCALLSELSVTAVAGVNRVRIGGFGTSTGTYTLAFRAPATCAIVGAVPVELQKFSVE